MRFLWQQEAVLATLRSWPWSHARHPHTLPWVGGAPFPAPGGIVSSLQLSVNPAWHRAAQWQEVGPGFEPSVCWSLSPYHPSPCTHSRRLAGWSLSVSFSSLRKALSLGPPLRLRIRDVCPVAPRSKVGPAASLQVLCGAHHRSHIRT